jgi:hypothetical protein
MSLYDGAAIILSFLDSDALEVFKSLFLSAITDLLLSEMVLENLI